MNRHNAVDSREAQSSGGVERRRREERVEHAAERVCIHPMPRIADAERGAGVVRPQDHLRVRSDLTVGGHRHDNDAPRTAGGGGVLHELLDNLGDLFWVGIDTDWRSGQFDAQLDVCADETPKTGDERLQQRTGVEVLAEIELPPTVLKELAGQERCPLGRSANLLQSTPDRASVPRVNAVSSA